MIWLRSIPNWARWLLGILFIVGSGILGFSIYALNTYTDAHIPVAKYAPPPEKQNPKASPNKLKQHIQKLTQISPPRNHKHPDSLDKAASYIRKQWIEMKLLTKDQTFVVDKKTYRNVIVKLGPEKGARLIIGAHYDVCGDQPGADDNASGIAGLIELSRLLLPYQKSLHIPLELVAYTLEEPPYFKTEHMGSAVHARTLHENKASIAGMISLEMIGFFSNQPDSQRYPIPLLSTRYPTKGNFLAAVSRADEKNRAFIDKLIPHMRKGTTLNIRALMAPSFVVGIDFSDHLNYWDYGYPALMLTDTSFFRSPHHHKKTDTPETLDYTKMAGVIRGLAWAIRRMKQ